MHLTRAADYALRVMVYLTGIPPGNRTNRTAISDATGVSGPYLAKVLQALVRGRLIRSRRGVGGGFELARPSEQVSMLNVIEAIEGVTRLNSCFGSEEACDRSAWCGVRQALLKVEHQMLGSLRASTVAELALDTAMRQRALVDPANVGTVNVAATLQACP